MARVVAVLLLVMVLGGCGPAPSLSAALKVQGRGTRSASIGSRPGSPPGLVSRELLGAAPAAGSVPYDRLLDARGQAVDGEAMAGLLQHRGELEALYADAIRGDVRALPVVRAVEGRFAYYGRLSAQEALTPGCLMAAEFVAGCHPNYSVLEAVEGSPMASRLWTLTVLAYQARLKELEKTRQLNAAMLNAVAAGMMWAETLTRVSGEGALSITRELGPGEKESGGGLKLAEAGLELSAMVDEATGLTREALEAKLAEAEVSTPGQRLPADVAALEKARASLDRPPPGVAAGNSLWRDYRKYFDERLEQMKAAQKGNAPTKKPVEPPRTWESYRKLREDFARGRMYEAERAEFLRGEAAMPKEQRIILRDFEEPVMERNVGVTKGDGVFFPDVLVVEGKVPPGQMPRVEVFSMKSVNLAAMSIEEWKAQITGHIRYAMEHYGGVIDIRRARFGLRGKKVGVTKIHLIYDIKFMPNDVAAINKFIAALSKDGVEVRFE